MATLIKTTGEQTAVTPKNGKYFTLDEAGNEISHPDGYSGYYIETTEEADIDLYPVFAEARWLYFNTGEAGNGATYVGAPFAYHVDIVKVPKGYSFTPLDDVYTDPHSFSMTVTVTKN